jgi:hypothetical protein
MNDILEDLNRWLNLLTVERRLSLRAPSTKSRAYAPSSQQLRTQAPDANAISAWCLPGRRDYSLQTTARGCPDRS